MYKLINQPLNKNKMKNLTKNQEQIIETLVAEFTNINESRVMQKAGNNPLLAYTDEVYSISNQEEEERNIIEAKNHAIIRSRQDKIKSDYDYLVNLLDEVDAIIMIEKRDKDIKISVENLELYINYGLESLGYKRFKYQSDIQELSEVVTTQYQCREYDSILDVINSEDFAKSFKQLVNRAIR